MKQDPPTSVSLLMRARSGDQAAWAKIVDIYGPLVFEQCRRCGFQKSDAADVTQEVFLAVWQGLSNFRRDRPGDSFLRWMRSIASRKIVDRRRRDAVNPQGVGGTTAQTRVLELADPEDIPWQPDQLRREAFQQAVRLLKGDFRESTWRAFWMSVVQNMSTADVAAELKMTEQAVRTARSRVRNRLIDELGDLLELSNEPSTLEGTESEGT